MVIAVTHGAFINGIICNVLGIPPDQFGRMSLRGNTGLSVIEMSERGAYLVRLNDTSHLEEP